MKLKVEWNGMTGDRRNWQRKSNSEFLNTIFFLLILSVTLLLSALPLNPHANLPLNPGKMCSTFTLHTVIIQKLICYSLDEIDTKRTCIFCKFLGMICHSWFIQPQFTVICIQLKDRMNLENELKAVIHNYNMFGFQNFLPQSLSFYYNYSMLNVLQKPAQQNILQYEGQIFKELIFVVIPAHTLACSLSFSKLQQGDRQSEDEV